MSEFIQFIKDLNSEFQTLSELLSHLLKSENVLEDNLLVEKGFLIKSYSVNWNSLNLDSIKTIQSELRRCVNLELDLKNKLNSKKKSIKNVEKDYNSYGVKKGWPYLELENLFVQYMNNAFRTSRLALVQFDELISLINAGYKMKRVSGSRVEKIVISLEKMTNQTMKFIAFLRQIDSRLEVFVNEHSYSNPRMYGRAMSKKEAKKTISKQELIGSPSRGESDLIGVFDCTNSTLRKLKSMSRDTRSLFFKSIGVTGPVTIVFFETPLVPTVGPIPQSNGLREYKFPKGINVEILEAA